LRNNVDLPSLGLMRWQLSVTTPADLAGKGGFRRNPSQSSHLDPAWLSIYGVEHAAEPRQTCSIGVAHQRVLSRGRAAPVLCPGETPLL
jgi:hypothetical protein